MNPATILLITLLQGGYWFGGREANFTALWRVEKTMPDCTLVWDLSAGNVTLSSGKAPMEGNPKAVSIVSVDVPSVRARTQMLLTCRLIAKQDQRELYKSSHVVHVLPDHLLQGLAARLGNKRVCVIERESEHALSKLLRDAGVPCERLDSVRKLGFTQPPILVVSPDYLRPETPAAEETALLELVRAGSSVVILPQRHVQQIMGYPLQMRRLGDQPNPDAEKPDKPHWSYRTDHALLRDLSPQDLRSMETPVDVGAIALPVDEPAVEVMWWPQPVPSEEPAPIDALLVTKTLGEGRLVLCQWPLYQWPVGSFADDPRAQIMLVNLLDYAAIRAEPTPAPSRRPQPREPQPVSIPTIQLP